MKDQRAETPTLGGVIDQTARTVVASMHTGAIARVVSYDSTKQRARVQPVIRGRYDDGESFQFPQLVDVPVMFPQGGGYSITFPLQAGDHVWLVFSERSADEWRARGGSDVEPQSTRRFDLSDAFAIPGPRPDNSPLLGVQNNAVALGSPSMRVEISNGGIKIGTPGVDLLELLDSLIGVLESATVTLPTGTAPFSPGVIFQLSVISGQLATIKG